MIASFGEFTIAARRESEARSDVECSVLAPEGSSCVISPFEDAERLDVVEAVGLRITCLLTCRSRLAIQRILLDHYMAYRLDGQVYSVTRRLSIEGELLVTTTWTCKHIEE
jgi:hypothetical protein